jgi:hypothetical protein
MTRGAYSYPKRGLERCVRRGPAFRGPYSRRFSVSILMIVLIVVLVLVLLGFVGGRR